AARQRGKDAGWFWRRQNPQEILLTKPTPTQGPQDKATSQQPRAQRARLQEQPTANSQQPEEREKLLVRGVLPTAAGGVIMGRMEERGLS
ncbi:MAG TPA: hypothetical protein PKY11_10015, partial [Kiritimatiellia bacterium]|nr:hypothetical protein [Kiritimatiellia bacterium]